MKEILQSVWLQGGAVGLLAVGGWVMFWIERRDHRETRKRAERAADERSSATNDALVENARVLQLLAERIRAFTDYLRKNG